MCCCFNEKGGQNVVAVAIVVVVIVVVVVGLLCQLLRLLRLLIFVRLQRRLFFKKKKRFSETLNRNQLRSRVRRNLTGGQKSEYEQKIEFPTTRPILGQNLVSQKERQMPHAA